MFTVNKLFEKLSNDKMLTDEELIILMEFLFSNEQIRDKAYIDFLSINYKHKHKDNDLKHTK